VIDESFSQAVLAYIGTPGHLSDAAPDERAVDAMGDVGLTFFLA
jgi:hypothetical protein